ncbi:MAG: hypothetical protein IKP65_08605 [Alphaproteobacteria bacterium]|nr:hypothetical protein [Alphaproteobacteria bacterium]
MHKTLEALIAKVKEIKIEPDCEIYTKDDSIFLKFPNSRQLKLATFTKSRIDVLYLKFNPNSMWMEYGHNKYGDVDTIVGFTYIDMEPDSEGFKVYSEALIESISNIIKQATACEKAHQAFWDTYNNIMKN